MGKTIQFESRTEEFSAITTHEYDEMVLEYYDQPSKIEMRYLAKSGCPVAFWNTPDFFVLRTDRVGWEECVRRIGSYEIPAECGRGGE
jgi:putative transposase